MTVNRQWLLAKRPEGMIGPPTLNTTKLLFPARVTVKCWCVTSIFPSTLPSVTGW